MVKAFWAMLAVLWAQNIADMTLLRAFTSPNSHETMPLLAHSLKMLGLDGSIWMIRILLFSFSLALMLVKVACPKSLPYLNQILLATNVVYLAGMFDELFFTGIVPSPGGMTRAPL